MKMMTTPRQVEIICEMFDSYVEPVASSFMSGEVPSTVFKVHQRGTREKDWLAFVRFRNTLTISVFKCEVYLDDIVSLCRRCKIWLLTEPIYKIIVTYFMLNPLYQCQCIDFKHDNLSDYESMLTKAEKLTYRFIKKHFAFEANIQKTILEMLHIHMQLFTNTVGPRNLNREMEIQRTRYVDYMMRHYPMAYKTAIHFKASKSIVSEDGFIRLERIENIKRTEYIGQDDPDSILKRYEEEDLRYEEYDAATKKKYRAYSKKPPKKTKVTRAVEAGTRQAFAITRSANPLTLRAGQIKWKYNEVTQNGENQETEHAHKDKEEHVQ